MSFRNLFLFVFLLTGLCMLAACQAEPTKRPPRRLEPVELPSEVTLEPAAAGTERISLEELLAVVSDAAAWNFTYAETTEQGLAATSVASPGKLSLARSEVEEYLNEILARKGFTLRPVGPENLRTWLVEPVAGGPREAAFEIFPLAHIPAQEAADRCREVPAESPFTIATDEGKNAVLVYASARDLERIRGLLERIDVDEGTPR